MFDPRYLAQVRLLIRCLPEIARQACFALKGGTAINLFFRDMPRISVDIDLAYLPLKPRDEALMEISDALKAIASDLRERIEGATIQMVTSGDYAIRLIVSAIGAVIKIEPNLVFRGSVHPPLHRELVPACQRMFASFARIATLREAELYGSKLCAALDRQHPRDLFDIGQMLAWRGITNEVRLAFVVYLSGHARPVCELLDPRMQNIESIVRDQFVGMTTGSSTLRDLVNIQKTLAGQVIDALTERERMFLVSIEQGAPVWSLLSLDHIHNLPAINWKITNVQRMNPIKRQRSCEKLKRILHL